MYYRNLLIGLLACAAPLAATLYSSTAEACSPPFWEDVRWTLPADGEIAPPDTRIALFVVSELSFEVDLLVTDEAGDVVAGETQIRSTGGLFTGMREFIPDEPLADGSYTLHVGYEEFEHLDETEDFELSFEIDSSVDPGPAPEAIDFDWYVETYSEGVGNSCIWAERFAFVDMEPPAGEFAYLRIIMSDIDGNERTHYLQPEELGTSPRQLLFFDIECVAVTAGHINGVESELIKKCEPAKCAHYETNLPDEPGITDWSTISGCDDSEEPIDRGADDDGGSCSTIAGPSHPALLLLILGLVLACRRSLSSRPTP